MKKLVAYYSRTGENWFGGSIRTISEGNTEKAAKMIAKAAGADLYEIRQAISYSDNYTKCIQQAKEDLKHNRRPALVDLPASLDEYGEIWLGSPIYWGTMPMAAFTFLDSFDWSGKTIHPFCTHEGSGLAHMPADIAKQAKGAAVTDGLAILGSAVDQAGKSIEQWISRIQNS